MQDPRLDKRTGPDLQNSPYPQIQNPLDETNCTDMAEGKVLVVSNRLPVTITRKNDGSYDYAMSSGGLVTALQGLKKSTEFQWLGWPGLEIRADERIR
ncbi:hypothetical protein OXX79_000869 [Metschnikowia pulcherrima]